MSEKKYVLEMTEEQASICAQACEFYARIRMGQFEEIPRITIERDHDALAQSSFCDRRDNANMFLLAARTQIYPELHGLGHSYGVGKFEDADRAYDIYQALRGPLGDERGVYFSDRPGEVPKCTVKETPAPAEEDKPAKAAVPEPGKEPMTLKEFNQLTEKSLKDFAAMLDGREYGEEITPAEEAAAKENNFVVVFGYSDDCCELRGAIDNEIDCFDGGNFWVYPDGFVDYNCTLDNRGLYEVEIIWKRLEPNGPIWNYNTKIPHETFLIYEDGEPFCRGIVFSLDRLEV